MKKNANKIMLNLKTRETIERTMKKLDTKKIKMTKEINMTEKINSTKKSIVTKISKQKFI